MPPRYKYKSVRIHPTIAERFVSMPLTETILADLAEHGNTTEIVHKAINTLYEARHLTGATDTPTRFDALRTTLSARGPDVIQFALFWLWMKNCNN